MFRYCYFILMIAQMAYGAAFADAPPAVDPYPISVENPPETTSEGFFFEFLRMMFMLGILLGLLLLVSWFLKRMLNTRMEQINTSSPIKILDRRNLSPKTVIYVIDVHGKRSVIAESPNGVTYIGDLNMKSEEDKDRSFESYLNKP